MDFEFTDEQKMFRDAIRKFAQKEIAPLVQEAEKNEEFPVHLFPRMGELGYLCLSYPEKYGGAGQNLVTEVIVFEEIGKISGPISGSFTVQSGLATQALFNHGTEEQKQKYLVPAIKGQAITAFGLTEPNAGSDASAIETTARKEGNKYTLTGSKIYISNGTIADFITVVAYSDRSKKHKGMSLFILDKDTPGLTRNKMHKFCTRSVDTAELGFDDCPIPVENLIGEECKGWQYLMETLTPARILFASSRLGASQSAFNSALDYAKVRVQFGRPISKFQINAFKLANMALEIEASYWLVYHSAWLYDQGNPTIKESAMAKLWATEVYQRVAIEACQIFGGAAALEESDINRHYRDSYLGRVGEGTQEIQHMIIARELGAFDV